VIHERDFARRALLGDKIGQGEIGISRSGSFTWLVLLSIILGSLITYNHTAFYCPASSYAAKATGIFLIHITDKYGAIARFIIKKLAIF
jgi:hypothetical protein